MYSYLLYSYVYIIAATCNKVNEKFILTYTKERPPLKRRPCYYSLILLPDFTIITAIDFAEDGEHLDDKPVNLAEE